MEQLSDKLKKQYYPLFSVKQNKHQLNSNITYSDSEQLEVQFSSCFFRVDRILALVESLERFQTIIDRPIITNGKLVQIFEMRSPPDGIEHMIVHKLFPLGFEYKKDLIILEEQLIYGLYTLFPARRLDWRNMKIKENADDTDEGNYIITSTMQVIFNNYKTFKTYGKQVFDIEDKDLIDVINSYI